MFANSTAEEFITNDGMTSPAKRQSARHDGMKSKSRVLGLSVSGLSTVSRRRDTKLITSGASRSRDAATASRSLLCINP